MVATQLASARVGRVTGKRLGHSLKAVMPPWLIICWLRRFLSPASELMRWMPFQFF